MKKLFLLLAFVWLAGCGLDSPEESYLDCRITMKNESTDDIHIFIDIYRNGSGGIETYYLEDFSADNKLAGGASRIKAITLNNFYKQVTENAYDYYINVWAGRNGTVLSSILDKPIEYSGYTFVWDGKKLVAK